MMPAYYTELLATPVTPMAPAPASLAHTCRQPVYQSQHPDAR